MRFRGLPRDLNCGSVELALAKASSSTQPLLPTCGGCGFVSMAYFVLAECGHVQCDSCSLVFREDDDTEDGSDLSCCSVCHGVSQSTAMKISVASLENTCFRCPCGEVGTLRQLRVHRRTCHATVAVAAADSDCDSPPTPSSATHRGVGVIGSAGGYSSEGDSKLCRPSSASSTHAGLQTDADSVSAAVRGVILEELKRVEEDIVNRVEDKRAAKDAEVERLSRKLKMLEGHVAQLRFDVNNRPQQVALPSEWQRTLSTVRDLQQQVTHLSIGMTTTQAGIIDSVIARTSQSVTLWFNVTKLLQKFNRQGAPAMTDPKESIIAGYPCAIQLQVDWVEGRKMLGVFIGPANLPNSAEWPMKRRIYMRIFNGEDRVFAEDSIETTDDEADNCFRSQTAGGCYGVDDICTIEELTNEQFYRRSHGMVCVEIEVGLL